LEKNATNHTFHVQHEFTASRHGIDVGTSRELHAACRRLMDLFFRGMKQPRPVIRLSHVVYDAVHNAYYNSRRLQGAG
jgi:hypothetical protein